MYKEKVFFLAVSAAMLLGAMRLLPRRAQPMEPVTLAAASAPHYIALNQSGDNRDPAFLAAARDAGGAALEYCEDITDAFVRDVSARNPAVLLLTGNLTFNGTRESHLALAEKLQRIEDAGTRVLVLPGPGDLDNPDAAAYRDGEPTAAEGVDVTEFLRIYGAFGWDEALSRDEASLSYVAEAADQLRVLMVDVNASETPGSVPETTLLWIRRQLEDARREGIRVLAGSCQAALAHNGDRPDREIGNRDDLLSLYRQYSNVVCGVCGGLELQHIAEDGVVTEISGSALTAWPLQYGLLTLEGTTAEYTTASASPSEAAADEAWRDLWNAAYRRAGADLAGGATVASGIDRLCTFFAAADARYTAGQGSQIPWDDAVYREWQERGSSLTPYLQSIEADGFRDYAAYRFRFR